MNHWVPTEKLYHKVLSFLDAGATYVYVYAYTFL